MTAPFGITFSSSLDQLQVVEELGQGGYIVQPPSPHPLLEQYVVRATPRLGVVWIKGLTPLVANDAFGIATRAMADRLGEQLAQRYGRGRKIDTLMPGSMWDEPKEWMSGLTANERQYGYIWERPDDRSLPEDLESIFLGAAPMEFDARIVIEYSSMKLELAAAELEEQMATLL